jgi:acryloyl-coenzyme A reductase
VAESDDPRVVVMRAMVVASPGGPEAFEAWDVPDPQPSDRDCVVRVLACGVCSHDVATRSGTLRRGIVMPVICGHEVAGEVVEVGRGVQNRRVGDRVLTLQRRRMCGACGACRSGRETLCRSAEFLGDVGLNGGYAEFVLVEEDNLVPLPDSLIPEQACIIACTVGSELNAIRDVGRVRAGETVLVTGAGGGLGVHGVQVALACGARVLAVTSSAAKVEVLEKLGAEVVQARAGEDFAEQVRDMTAGEGVDAAIDNVGTPVFQSVRRSMALGGRWVLVGQLTGEFVPFNPAQLFLSGVSMLSAISTTRAQLYDALNLVSRGQVTPIVTGSFALADVAEAHREVKNAAAVGRVVVVP